MEPAPSPRLPLELILTIVLYVAAQETYDGPAMRQRCSDLARLSRVSRAIGVDAARHLYKGLNFRSYRNEREESTLDNRSRALVKTLQDTPKLRRYAAHSDVYIECWPLDYEPEVEKLVKTVLNHIHQPRKLWINAELGSVFATCKMAWLLKTAPQSMQFDALESLRLSVLVDINDSPTILSDLSKLPRLRHLAIDYLDCSSLVTTPPIGVAFESLCLGDCITGAELAWFIQPCASSLRHLSLRYCWEMLGDADSIKWPEFASLDYLESLTISFEACDQDCTHILLELVHGALSTTRGLPSLRRLTFGSEGDAIPFAPLCKALLSIPPSLHHLKIWGIVPTDQHYQELWAQMTGHANLKSIRLAHVLANVPDEKVPSQIWHSRRGTPWEVYRDIY